jgi:hypothetical protein
MPGLLEVPDLGNLVAGQNLGIHPRDASLPGNRSRSFPVIYDKSMLNGRALYVYSASNIVVSANDSSCKLVRSHKHPNVL